MNRNLDFLRAVAVLLVVAGHLLAFFGAPAQVWGMDATCLGRVGVLLFFVHTALVLMQSLERNPNPKLFLIRRVFRIYPLAIVVIAATVLFHLPLARLQAHHFMGWHADGMDILANIFLVQDFSGRVSILGPSWSLTYELLMYLLLPFIFLLVRGKNRALAFFFAAVILSVGVRQLSVVGGYAPLFIFLYFMPCFMPGVVAYELLKSKQSRWPAWGWPIALLTLCVLYTLMLKTDYAVYAFCGLVGLLIPRFAQSTSGLFTSGSHTIAKYSYGLYLCHFAAIYLAFEAGARLPMAARIAVFVTLLAGMPVFLYHTIEAPMITVGKRFAFVNGKLVYAKQAAGNSLGAAQSAEDRETAVLKPAVI
jgi:peptidoglycan/LPS O-acetylase OafA/YrhL